MKQRIQEELKNIEATYGLRSSTRLNRAAEPGAFPHRTVITTSDLFMSIKKTGICQLMQSAM